MNSSSRLSRRKFLQLAAVGVGSLGIAEGCKSRHASNLYSLSSEEARLVEAVADQIIPPDDWPGGRESGVMYFIDRQLAGPYRRYRSDYRAGLQAINEECMRRYGKNFENLAWGQQTSFLKEMESGSLSQGVWSGGFGRRFFELLRSHSLQGYYGSPRHGGNKNFVSYKMVGLDYPQTRGRNHRSS